MTVSSLSNPTVAVPRFQRWSLKPRWMSLIITGGRTSLDVPRSPSLSYASSNEGSSMMAPPSPTLFIWSSVHFAMSNKHGRKPSWASSGEGHSSLKETEPDHGGIRLNTLHCATSAATSVTAISPTQTHVDELSVRSGKGSRSCSHSCGKKGSRDFDGITAASETIGRSSGELTPGDPSKDDEEEEVRKEQIELIDDEANVDPALFEFKLYTLAYMLHLKNIDLLESLGGLKGLLKGLGMSWTRGLGRKALMRSNSIKAGTASDSRPGFGTASASQWHD